MKNPLKQRFERYCQYLSDENAKKTYQRLFQELSWEQRKTNLERDILTSTDKGTTDTKYFDNQQVIVSLTSYGNRIYDVHLAIESIMQQTAQPNKIILWLSNEYKDAPLPIRIQKQIDRGLDVRYCKDLGPHTKLIPALKQYPDDVIITIDDDCIYASDMIENLINSYRKAPQYIHTNRARQIKLSANGLPDTYRNWNILENQHGASPLYFLTGVGGTLYPPHTLSDEVFNEDAFLRLCPKADDIWFYAMALLNNTQCYKVATHDPYMYCSNHPHENSLLIHNLLNGGNDIQIANVFTEYNLYEKFKSVASCCTEKKKTYQGKMFH